MPKDRVRDPSAILWDLIVERAKELIPGITGFIGRDYDCLFRIWEGFEPDRHDPEDYRTKLGNAVSRNHDFLRIEQNGSIRLTHRTDKPSYVITKDRRNEFPFPTSSEISHYYRFVKNLQESIPSLELNDEKYLFPGDLLILTHGYGFEIRAIQKYHQPRSKRLEDTQIIRPEDIVKKERRGH